MKDFIPCVPRVTLNEFEKRVILEQACQHIANYCAKQAFLSAEEALLWGQCEQIARGAIAKAEGR